MTDRHPIWHEADGIQMDLRALEARFVRLRSMLAALNLRPPNQDTTEHRPRSVARAGLSPRELHPDACPHCEIVAGHTADCPTQTGENPNYGPGNPDWEHDRDKEQTT